MSSEGSREGVQAPHGLQSLLRWLPGMVITPLAINKDYFSKNVSPFRLGELARAFLLGSAGLYSRRPGYLPHISSLVGAYGLSQEGQTITKLSAEIRRAR